MLPCWFTQNPIKINSTTYSKSYSNNDPFVIKLIYMSYQMLSRAIPFWTMLLKVRDSIFFAIKYSIAMDNLIEEHCSLASLLKSYMEKAFNFMLGSRRWMTWPTILDFENNNHHLQLYQECIGNQCIPCSCSGPKYHLPPHSKAEHGLLHLVLRLFQFCRDYTF